MNILRSCRNSLMNHGRFIPLCTLLLFLITVLHASTLFANDEQVLVTVNNDSITTADLEQSIIQQHRVLDETQKTTFEYRKLLDKLVNDKLIQQEAMSMGIGEEPWLLDKLHQMLKINARRAYVRNNFKPDLAITDDEVVSFFNTYYFRMKLRTISVQTKDEGIRVKEQLASGLSMDSLAREISLDTKKIKGGEHNFLHYADIENELRLVAENLKVGEISDPVPYRNAFVVIRLEDYRDPDTLELPLMSIRIEKILKNQKQETAWNAFLDSLASLSNISTDEQIAAKIRDDVQNVFSEEFLTDSKEPVLLIDDSHFVTEEDLRKEISHKAMVANTLPPDSLFLISINGVKMELVLDYEAEKAGYYEKPEIINAYNKSFDSSLVEVYLKETILSQITFNREEFQEYYEENLDEFREPPDLQLAHLIVSTKDSADLIDQRLQEGASFEYLARQIDPENNSESNPNRWQPLMEYPDEVSPALDSLAIGTYSNIFQITEGWIIFYVKNKRAGAQKSFNDVEMQLREIMFQKKFNELLDETLTLLKDNSEIKYYTENIDSFFN